MEDNFPFELKASLGNENIQNCQKAIILESFAFAGLLVYTGLVNMNIFEKILFVELVGLLLWTSIIMSGCMKKYNKCLRFLDEKGIVIQEEENIQEKIVFTYDNYFFCREYN